MFRNHPIGCCVAGHKNIKAIAAIVRTVWYLSNIIRFAYNSTLHVHVTQHFFYRLHKSLEHSIEYSIAVLAIRVLVVTEFAITLPRILNRKCCIYNTFILSKATNMNTPRA